MWLLLAFASALTFGLGSFIFKIGADQKLRNSDILCGLYFSGAILLFISNGTNSIGHISMMALAAGVVIAIGSSLGNSLYLKVLRAGPASLSAPLVSCSNLLVAIMSIAIFHEPITYYKACAIALFFIAIAFLSFDPNEHLTIKDKSWYLLIIATIVCIFFREGGLKIGQEIELNTIFVLFCAYVYAFLFNAFLTYRQDRRDRQYHPNNLPHNSKRGFLMGTLVGIFSAGGLALYAKAIALGPASIIAPIFTTRNFVVVLLATVICKERLSKCQLIAIVLLISASALLCLN